MYRTFPYYASVVLFDLIPNRVLPPVMFTLLTYPVAGLYPHYGLRPLRFTWVLVLTNVSAALMSMAIGAAAPSNAVANLVGSMVLMVALLFGGFMLNKDNVPVLARPLEAASAFSYAYEVGVGTNGAGG